MVYSLSKLPAVLPRHGATFRPMPDSSDLLEHQVALSEATIRGFIQSAVIPFFRLGHGHGQGHAIVPNRFRILWTYEFELRFGVRARNGVFDSLYPPNGCDRL